MPEFLENEPECFAAEAGRLDPVIVRTLAKSSKKPMPEGISLRAETIVRSPAGKADYRWADRIASESLAAVD